MAKLMLLNRNAWRFLVICDGRGSDASDPVSQSLGVAVKVRSGGDAAAGCEAEKSALERMLCETSESADDKLTRHDLVTSSFKCG